MKAILFASVVAMAAAAPKPEELTSAYTYEQYAAEFRPTLRAGSAEWKAREAIFNKHLAEAIAHNSNPRKTWVKAANRFFDMSKEEFRRFKGYIPRANYDGITRTNRTAPEHSAPAGWVAPASIDWRTKNVLTAVKDQGACGGCWAFAATEALEASVAINNKTAPPVLSVEQILDCTPNPQMCGGTGGCNGATAELAFQYADSARGITLDSNNPFSGGGSCPSTPLPPAARAVSFARINANDRTSVMHALATLGPVTIGVDASTWQFYGGGVSDACNTEGDLTLDHAVQLVAYETQADGSVVWTVRNSWNAGWGENGFIRLKDTSACVTDPAPQDGSGCPNGPSKVTVCGPCGLFYEVSWPTAYAL